MSETQVGPSPATPATGAPKFGATVTVQASHLAMLAKQFGLDPEKTTNGQLLAAMKEREQGGREEFTPATDLESFEPLFDENKVWQRSGSKDKTLHRVVNLFPQFTGSSGEDVVNCANDNDAPVLGVKAVYKVIVQRFEQTPGPDKKPIRNDLTSFQMTAKDFLASFELAT